MNMFLKYLLTIKHKTDKKHEWKYDVNNVIH